MEEYKTQTVFKEEGETGAEHAEKMVKWYRRGAIKHKELVYQIAQSEEKMEFEELAELFLNILDINTKKEKRDIRHKLLEIIIRRGN